MRTTTTPLALAGVLAFSACLFDDDGDPDQNPEGSADDDDADDGDDDGDDDDDDGTTGADDDDGADDDPSGTVGGDGHTDLGWHEDIAPIVVGHCGGCHNEGGPAPFSVMSYESASGWALPMAYAVQSRTMPPFFAENTDECEVRFPWLEDPRLSEEQIGMIVDWADGGAPEGN